jgi:hypothetical protein
MMNQNSKHLPEPSVSGITKTTAAETALTIKRNALKTMRLPAEVASPLSRASKVVLPQSMFRNA